jgi:pimeloyl-ACP methyl ester carboxylesterase
VILSRLVSSGGFSKPQVPWLVAAFAAILVAVSLYNLEGETLDLSISEIGVGATPATVYRLPDTEGPLVVVAHGFAGSRQLMRAYSLTLARSGYTVVAFDFEGHGRNPTPMSGDVDAIEGTTALLVAETRRVLAAGRRMFPDAPGAALLGHSMATDVLVRAGIAERDTGTPVDAIVAISPFSAAIDQTTPRNLLAISGEWEPGLRDFALRASRMVDPNADEGDTATSDGVVRRAVVAPSVEHVGVLYSGTALRETLNWLDATFERRSDGTIVTPGVWILLLLGGIVVLFRPVTRLVTVVENVQPQEIKPGRFWFAVLLPAIAVPLLLVPLDIPFLPVLVADYLTLHLAAVGIGQLLLLRVWRQETRRFAPGAALLLAVWGIGVFGLAIDRYAASFVPTTDRLPIMIALALGTIPFMIADGMLTGSGRGVWWRRIVARLVFILSLGAAAALDPERLLFLFFIFPVLILFFLVHGSMGRWIAQRAGALPAGVGLGLCLAWALGVTFPLFSPS